MHSENAQSIVEAQRARDAAANPLDLFWVATDKCLNPSVRKMLSRLCVREFKTKKQGKVTWVWSTWTSLTQTRTQPRTQARSDSRKERG